MTQRPDPTGPNAQPNPEWTCWRDERHRVYTRSDFGWPQCIECSAAPSYADRFTYLDLFLELGVYVPAEQSLASIAPRSAIVGLPHHDGDHHIEVDLEGWVNGPAQYGDLDARGLWEAGVEHAAGRLVVRYPTTARIEVEWSDLIKVGSYFPAAKRFDIRDEDSVTAWLDAGAPSPDN